MVSVASDLIVYVKFSENNVIIRPSRYFYRHASVMILLAFLSCLCFFFFVKDEIASFQLKQIIVFLN